MSEAKAKGRDMTLRILACRHVYHGKNTRGDEYDIYEIDAAKLDGSSINEKLRSFAILPVGQEIEVTVTPFNSERHGRSFTLQPKGSRAASAQGQINELREQVDMQRAMIASLVKRVDVLETLAGSLNGVAQTRGQTPTAELAEKFGDEAPW
jgi:hypothetical protein